MGRGRGQGEHDQDKEDIAIVDDPTGEADDTAIYADEELDDEAKEALEEAKMAAQLEKEKTAEQKAEESKRRWQAFYYNPPEVQFDNETGEWTGKPHIPATEWYRPAFWILFGLSVILTVLTLEQWHGTRAWRRPVDLYPLDFRGGGWPQENHNIRFTGAIFTITGTAFSWVLRPSADKYRCMFAWLLIGVIMTAIAFGQDLFKLTETTNLSYCNGINDMKTHKYLCEFTRFRATVILDILVSLFSLVMACLLLYQAQMGYVSRRLVFDAQRGTWDKIIPNPDLPWDTMFPRAFQSFRLPWNILCVFNFAFSGSLIALSVTQSTGELILPPGYDKPIYNDGYTLPRDLYVIGSEEAFRYGSWPWVNFELRLSSCALADVILAFAIQWRNDGRFMQLVVMLISLAAGALFLSCFHWDYEELFQAMKGTCYANANGSRCVYARYIAVLVIEFFLGMLLIIFNLRNLWVWFIQARKPIEQEHVSYGWWCFGEWQAKAEGLAKEARAERDAAAARGSAPM